MSTKVIRRILSGDKDESFCQADRLEFSLGNGTPRSLVDRMIFGQCEHYKVCSYTAIASTSRIFDGSAWVSIRIHVLLVDRVPDDGYHHNRQQLFYALAEKEFLLKALRLANDFVLTTPSPSLDVHLRIEKDKDVHLLRVRAGIARNGFVSEFPFDSGPLYVEPLKRDQMKESEVTCCGQILTFLKASVLAPQSVLV